MSLNSIKVILHSGKVINHSVNNDKLIVKEVLSQLKQSQGKQFQLFKDSKILKQDQEIQINYYSQQYIMALQKQNTQKKQEQINHFQDQKQAYEYLKKLGLNQKDLLSANIDPRDKQGLIKNYIFNAQIKKQFQYNFKYDFTSKLKPQQKKRMIEQFVKNHVLQDSQSSFETIKEETTQLLLNNVETFVETVMNSKQ